MGPSGLHTSNQKAGLVQEVNPSKPLEIQKLTGGSHVAGDNKGSEYWFSTRSNTVVMGQRKIAVYMWKTWIRGEQLSFKLQVQSPKQDLQDVSFSQLESLSWCKLFALFTRSTSSLHRLNPRSLCVIIYGYLASLVLPLKHWRMRTLGERCLSVMLL